MKSLVARKGSYTNTTMAVNLHSAISQLAQIPAYDILLNPSHHPLIYRKSFTQLPTPFPRPFYFRCLLPFFSVTLLTAMTPPNIIFNLYQLPAKYTSDSTYHVKFDKILLFVFFIKHCFTDGYKIDERASFAYLLGGHYPLPSQKFELLAIFYCLQSILTFAFFLHCLQIISSLIIHLQNPFRPPACHTHSLT